MRWLLLALGIGLAISLGARAQEQVAATSESAPSEPRPRGPGFGGRGGGFGGWLEMSPEEFQKLTDFMQQYSPKRWDAYNNMERNPRRQRVRQMMQQQYRTAQRLKEADPKAYDVFVKRVGVQDQIFDLVRQLRTADTNKRNALREQLRGKFAEVIDLGIQEREARIAIQEKQLVAEKKRLDEDKSHRDKLLDRQLNRAMSDNGLLGDEPGADSTREQAAGPEPTTAPSGN